MPHPKPEQIIPVDTLCWWSIRGSKPIKVKITKHAYLYSQFLHYEGIKEGVKGTFAFYHSDLKPIE
jgi:hypothetical protein